MKPVFFLVILQSLLLAQIDTQFVTTEVECQLLALDFPAAHANFESFLQKNLIKVNDKNESRIRVAARFTLTQQQFADFQSALPSFGRVTAQKIKTVNNSAKVAEIRLELSHLRQMRHSYEDILKKIDAASDKYLLLWNENKSLEDKIFTKERELLAFDTRDNSFLISFELNDEVTTPENTDVSFVNMPGAEYSYCAIENPTRGISNSAYQGVSLKYTFTKGKSYVYAGVLKAIGPEKSDSSLFTEMFSISFGQDFYSRHLGGGSNMYFNLYSGYTVGYMFVSGATSKSDYLFLTPSVGIELFKNKYILLDSKFGYLIPFAYTKTMRGMQYSLSFNFVF